MQKIIPSGYIKKYNFITGSLNNVPEMNTCCVSIILKSSHFINYLNSFYELTS